MSHGLAARHCKSLKPEGNVCCILRHDFVFEKTVKQVRCMRGTLATVRPSYGPQRMDFSICERARARVPLRHKMGTPWDVANAALSLTKPMIPESLSQPVDRRHRPRHQVFGDSGVR